VSRDLEEEMGETRCCDSGNTGGFLMDGVGFWKSSLFVFLFLARWQAGVGADEQTKRGFSLFGRERRSGEL
jgi:hypothetical protein